MFHYIYIYNETSLSGLTIFLQRIKDNLTKSITSHGKSFVKLLARVIQKTTKTLQPICDRYFFILPAPEYLLINSY